MTRDPPGPELVPHVGGILDPRGADDIVFEHLRADRSRAAVRGAFWASLTSLIPMVLNGGVFIVTSRYLVPADFGLVALAFAIASFAVGLGPLAFGEALIQQQSIRRSHIDTVFWLTLVSGCLLYGAVIALAPLLARTMGQPKLIGLVWIVALKIVFDLLAVTPNALIARRMAFHIVATRTAIATVISSLTCICLIVAGFGLWALAIAQIAGSAATCAAAYWGAGWIPGRRFRASSLGELARYGLFASANRFLQQMNLDQLAMAWLIGPAALGLYNFSKRLFLMLQDVVAGGLTSVSHVLLSSMQQDQAKVREAFLMATFGCSLVSLPLFMGLAAVANDAIPLIFGPQWVEAVWPVRFFCVIGLLSGIGVIQASLINSQGKSDWWFYYQLVRNILTIATVVLFHRQGVTVICAAMMAQLLILWPVTLWMVSKLTALSIASYFRQFLRPVIATIGLAIAVSTTARMAADWNSIVRLVAEIAAGGLCYCALILVLCRTEILMLQRRLMMKKAS